MFWKKTKTTVSEIFVVFVFSTKVSAQAAPLNGKPVQTRLTTSGNAYSDWGCRRGMGKDVRRTGRVFGSLEISNFKILMSSFKLRRLYDSGRIMWPGKWAITLKSSSLSGDEKDDPYLSGEHWEEASWCCMPDKMEFGRTESENSKMEMSAQTWLSLLTMTAEWLNHWPM